MARVNREETLILFVLVVTRKSMFPTLGLRRGARTLSLYHLGSDPRQKLHYVRIHSRPALFSTAYSVAHDARNVPSSAIVDHQ